MNTDALVGNLLPGFLINLVMGVAAWRTGSVRPSGAIMGLVLGTAIYGFLSWPGFLILVAFFVLGSALTRLGYGRKAAMGVDRSQLFAKVYPADLGSDTRRHRVDFKLGHAHLPVDRFFRPFP